MFPFKNCLPQKVSIKYGDIFQEEWPDSLWQSTGWKRVCSLPEKIQFSSKIWN